jgi:hypothetical protein
MHDAIEEVSPGAVFGLDDPQVGVETDLPGEISLGFGIGRRHGFHRRAESPIEQILPIKSGLRSRSIDVRGVVKAVDLDENRPRFIGAAPADHGEHAFDVAAPYIGQDPYSRFEAHIRCFFQNHSTDRPVAMLSA